MGCALCLADIMSENKVLVIFGSTGDLTFTKLLPALNQLILFNPLALNKIILIGRQVETLGQYLSLGKEKGLKSTDIEAIIPCLEYQYLQANVVEDYPTLKKAIKDFTHRFFYLATPPSMFATITEALSTHQILEKSNPNHRVALEKPFGINEKDAVSLSTFLHSIIEEKQLYRVDHYLAKPLIEHLPTLHQLITSFSPLFSNNALKSIDVIAYETQGISTRGKFYEATGAILDMVQSHLLLTLAKAFLMFNDPLSEATISLESSFFKHLTLNDASLVLGQYEGYRQEANVAPLSMVETYAFIPFTYTIPGQSSLAFSIATGKKLDKKEVSLSYTFLNGATITFMLSPTIAWVANESFLKIISTSQRDALDAYFKTFDPQLLAYTQVFDHFIEGKKSIFPHAEVVESTWHLVEKILQVKPKLTFYQSLKDLVK